ncbi:MAG: hypothetical protein MUE44_06795 [Oscillatoriaceae cyanobacterium Prado104]|nr:hypothetical protein [Oscillatoriaceae cyanobacterium Prado104]
MTLSPATATGMLGASRPCGCGLPASTGELALNRPQAAAMRPTAVLNQKLNKVQFDRPPANQRDNARDSRAIAPIMQAIFWLDLKASFRHCYLVRAQPRTGNRGP